MLDFVDTNLQESLPVSLFERVVFSSSYLLNHDLVTLDLAEDRRGDLGALQNGLTDLRTIVDVTDKQHSLEFVGLGVLGQVFALYFEHLPFLNTVLMSPIADNRVHGVYPPGEVVAT